MEDSRQDPPRRRTAADHPLSPNVIKHMRVYANENDGVYRGVLWETIMTLCDEVEFLQYKLYHNSSPPVEGEHTRD